MSELKKTFRCKQVKAAVWAHSNEHKGEIVKRYSIRIDKSYKNENEWVSTNYFNTDELPRVITVAQEAYKYLALQEGEGNGENPKKGGLL